MSFCVNIKSKQFKDTAARLGISEGQLELIAHKYGNSEGTYGQFPSDNYIMGQVIGRPELNADENIVRIWHERYQNAQTFATAEELSAAKTEALRFFEESSIGTTTLPDGRLQMVVAEPNSTEEPLISYMSNNAEQVIDGKLGVNKEQLISLLGSTMYKGNVQSVAVKELLQNAFDAVKIAQSQGKIQGKAKIRVNLDAAERTVTISDNGTGMSPEIVQKAFFTIGGSYKGENVDNRLKSGGLGLAKMAFLFSSEYVEVSTVKDGIKTYVNTNPEQIQNDNFKITTSRTDEPNGTTVTVKIPESYLDKNGEKRSIWFDTSPNFLSKPMIGNVDVEVTKKTIWGTATTTYDKSVIPEGYTPIGKATSDFGDIEMYVAPADSGDITAEVLISGLHQFTKWFSVKGATKGRFKVILNILPTVGVKSAVYPINNQREGFRATIEPEVKDIGYLLNQINRSLEKKSIAATFGSAMSMDVGKIAEVKREASNTDTLNSAVKEVLGQLATKQKTILGIPVGKTQENSLDLKSIRTQRETAEKSRNSSLNTSGINYDRNSSVSSVDTSGLDITKPLFHNNTTMVIGEDGQAVLNELGKLMMELKSLYVQTYKNAGIQSRFGDVIDHISKQFWGISFDKGYGGVNVNPSIINLLAINPFYQVQTYPGVDTALALTEYLTHLIIHEFNHNYAGGEGAGFTGRFPATYAEFAGIGKQFNKEWKNKLYTLIRDNLDTFIKYNKEYEKATNLGESFESDRITAREESTSRSTENDGKDLFWNRSGENVYENGEGSTEISETSQQGVEYVNHSGGAIGSDSYWGTVGERYGVKSNHYYHGRKTPIGNVEITEEQFNEGKQKVLQANRTLNRRPDRYMDLLARNWMQVKNSDSIFAIGHLKRGIVDGGTGWAVQMAIDAGKPVYVFDQERGEWFKNIGGQWSRSDVPTFTSNFAGIGTRQLNDAGRKAIEAVYEKTFSQQQVPQQQVQTEVSLHKVFQQRITPIGYKRTGEKIDSVDAGKNICTSTQMLCVEMIADAFNNGDLAHHVKVWPVSIWAKSPLEDSIIDHSTTLVKVNGKYYIFDMPQSEYITKTGNTFTQYGKTFNEGLIGEFNPRLIPVEKEVIQEAYQIDEAHIQNTMSSLLSIMKDLDKRNDFEITIAETVPPTRSEEGSINTEQAETPKVEQVFHEKSTTLTGQINTLIDSGIPVTEVREEANKLMDWISDQLTQYLEDPSIVWDKYFADTQDSSQREAMIDRISKMSRQELLELIGVDRILEIYSNEVLSRTEENADVFDSFDDEVSDKFDLIKENLKGLVQLGYSRFSGREGFSITLSEGDESTFDVTETQNTLEQDNPIDTNGENDPDRNFEEEGNQQEHWQIESRSREILDNASAQIKQALSDCLVLVDNGKRKEDGTPDYDIQTDDLGRNERVTQLNATRSIVKWTQGALSLQGMIDMLSSKEKENPWISQIITRLRDTSGNESDFQNEFFTVFSKHFQPYSVVIRNADGTFHTGQVNAHPALDDAMSAVKVQYRLGKLPLFNSNGVDTRNLEGLREVNNKLNALGQLSENNRKEAVTLVGEILTTVGFPQSEDSINRVLTDEVKNTLLTAVSNMAIKLDNAAKEKNYDPFKFKDNPNGITGYVQSILRPFTEALEDVMVSSIFDSGKMYQSYITPSWTTKLFKKMHLDNKNFHKFLLNEFATSEWFIDDKVNLLAEVSSDRLAKMSDAEKEDARAEYIGNHPEIWRTPWLRELVQMDEKARMETFVHRVQLNFNKSNYMRGMTDLEYVLSVFTEFYADGSKNYKGKKFAYYRLPMLSNKPSNEFIRFTRYSGATALAEITDGFLSIFNQEMSRIRTVRMLELNKADKGYIEYFNERGKEFQFLDYLNDYLIGEKKNTVLGELLNNKLDGKTIDESALTPLVEKAIREHLVEKGNALVSQYRNNGLFEALKNVENVGTSDAAVETAIREFAWNDMFAQANILELLITDKAYYKNEEDLQKRLAQVHSPGTRGNWDAVDYDGNRVSDGKLRIVKISDFAGKDVMINTLANLEEVFDKKIEEAEDSLKDQWRALKENIIAAYKKVNVVDGQAFVSPTAYRKKAIAFGEWSREAENTYNELMQGKFNLASLKSVFNPRKPFTYGKVNKNISEMTGIDTPIKTLNYGVQYKDSEYLLIMADALLREQETSRPNLLGALFDVMEESAKTNPAAGIDFIVFESGVKTGISGAISISDLVDNPDGRDIAFNRIWRRIINTDGSYNQAYVDTLNAEDYANQQTVPEHFMGHGGLQWGSQVRVIMPSDLEVSYLGQPVEYEFYDDAAREWKKLNKDGIRKEWNNTAAEIINDGIRTLKTEFGLNNSEYSQADRNIILSKILQREILSNARYGVDLLLACSVDEQGNFRIPLGDPIQSKRVEQLINSIIKNRINKIKVEGGTLVEVTNFGVSKRLERRYKDKNGNLLQAKRDYLAEGHTEAEFNQYVKENQAGIAYDECYAPAWAREIFENFADRNGNIDVEAIEMLDADLLKMFGYRIPTEDKYSCAPYKIVGFLPKEAGDGFMQPWETTVTDGSDFDVDKKNLMRMVINIKKKIMSKSEFAKANKITNEEELDNKYSKYRKDNNPSPANILKKIGDSGRIKLSATEKAELDAEEEHIRKRRIDKAKSLKDKKDNSAVESYNRKYAEKVEPLEKEYDTLSEKEDLTEKEERDMLKLDRRIEREVAKLDRELEGKKVESEAEYNKRIEEIESELSEIRKENESRILKDRKLSIIRKILDEGVFRDSSTIPSNERGVFLAVKRAYIDMMFEASKPTLGKDYFNNKIFNMQWAIATHASTADKMLNPGNFDPQKSMGYKVAAYRLGKHNWEDLNAMSIDALKEIVFTSKNLMEFDVQTQFYKQNSVAGQILGIFAVAKSAHAMFEGRNYGILVEDNFTIAGMDFGGIMSLDKMKDRSGVTLIGKTLGSLVSASADAVKDPVLNFMNINKETVNVLNAALRLGMDFDSISLLLSTKTISDILSTYYRNNLSKKVSLKNVIAQKIRELESDSTIGKNSPLAKQELTTEEMITAIRKDNPSLQYKILKAFQRLSNIADTINPLTNISRLNSVASAVGPQHIDSIMSKYKLDAPFKNIAKIGQKGVYEEIGRYDVFQDIPSLRAFYEAYNIVFGDSDNAGLFKQLGITTASEQFNEVLTAIPEDMRFLLMNNKKLLSSLGDFFQSYLLVQSNVASISQKERYIKNFAKWFTEQGFKSKYPNNPFIQAIQTDVVSKEGQEDKYYLKIETTGMEQSEKDALSAGWIQLEKENPDLSHWLFFYNFWRGGIGFSPKTFMGLVPLQVKEKIGGYLNTYRNLPTTNGITVFDQWIRNNWNNDSLVPRVSKIPISKDGKMLAKGRNYYKVAGSPYVKMNVDGRDVLFRRTSNFSAEYQFAEYEQITSLGNNGEYFEAFPFEDTAKPSAVPNTVDRGTLVSDQLETTEDNPNDVVKTKEEMEQDLVDFIDVLRGDEGRTAELGEAEMEERFDELTKDLGLSEDKAKFDDIMDNFCR